MHRTGAFALAAVTAACLMPASASAAQSCEAKVNWTYEPWRAYAAVQVDEASAKGDGCARLLPADGTRYTVTETFFSAGGPFVSAALTEDGERVGTIKATGGDLDAVVRTADSVAVYDGDGSKCGDTCFRTTGRWVAP